MHICMFSGCGQKAAFGWYTLGEREAVGGVITPRQSSNKTLGAFVALTLRSQTETSNLNWYLWLYLN